MGVVYRARHGLLRRPTAIKLIAPDKVGASSISRFEREVQTTARLSHPNTITIYDYGRTPEGVFYYAMELLDGDHLEDIVAVDGAQSAARTMHVLRHVADALAEAHAIGLVHRDIKPANVMLCRIGGVHDTPKVLDFGLVKEIGTDVQVTKADVVTGTPLYMAPETITNPDAVDARSDLYALGAVAYFFLTGAHVFEGDTVVEVCAKHLHDAPVPPSVRAGRPVPEALERLVLECLEKDPERRPRSSVDLVARLAALEGVDPWTRDDAAAWWERCGAAIEARHGVEKTDSTHTLDVDLGLRLDQRAT